MIKYFYVRTQDNRCPFAHRYDCLTRDDLLEDPTQSELYPFDRYDDRYLVTYLDGLDAPQATISSVSLANGDGTKYVKSNLPARTVTIKIMFNPNTEGNEIVNARVDLERVFGVGNFVQLYMVDSTEPWDLGSGEPYAIADHSTDITMPSNPAIYSNGKPVLHKFDISKNSTASYKYYRWDGYEWHEYYNPENHVYANGWMLSGRVETHESDMYGSQCWAQITVRCDDPRMYYWDYKSLYKAKVNNIFEGMYYSTRMNTDAIKNPGVGDNKIWLVDGNLEDSTASGYGVDEYGVSRPYYGKFHKPDQSWGVQSFSDRVKSYVNNLQKTGYIVHGNEYIYDATYITVNRTSNDPAVYGVKYNSEKTLWLYNEDDNIVVRKKVKYFDPYKYAGTTNTNWRSFSPAVVKVPVLYKTYTLKENRDGYTHACPEACSVTTSPVGDKFVDITEAVWDTYGISFHDSCNIPMTIRFMRGSNFPSTVANAYESGHTAGKTMKDVTPTIKYEYYDVNEDYVGNLYTIGSYWVNVQPGSNKGFDKSGDRITIYCESFPDEYEANAKLPSNSSDSHYANVTQTYDASRIRNRDAFTYYKDSGTLYGKKLLAYVPLSEDTWPMIMKGQAEGFRVKLSFKVDSNMKSNKNNWFSDAGVYIRPYRLAL